MHCFVAAAAHGVGEVGLQFRPLRTRRNFLDILGTIWLDSTTYLARRLQSLPGVFPQRRSPQCTRHAYHLFMLRLDPRDFGASRDAVLSALEAEGIPCSAGYGFSIGPKSPI